MKTIKGKELCKENCAWCKGYKDCKEDVLGLIEKITNGTPTYTIEALLELKSKIQGR